MGIFSTEIIAAEDTYVRGLAELQARRFHWLIRLHIVWEFAWFLHGCYILHMVTWVDSAVCDPKPIPTRLTLLLIMMCVLLSYRGATHVLLPGNVPASPRFQNESDCPFDAPDHQPHSVPLRRR